jgi:sugar (pentulose or hexulose) kinase
MFVGVDFVTSSVEALRAARLRELTTVRSIVLSGQMHGAGLLDRSGAVRCSALAGSVRVRAN